MHSAFWKGVELLSEPESDSVQSEGQNLETESTSKRMEGIGRVPKNVTQLKPVVNELMRKVIMIAI
jgi:hypothetical protein